MKNIKQLAALTALLTLANPAKAEEKLFTPMGTARSMKSIELANDQIMVIPANQRVPYYFIGTNTDHFAERAFANADMTNLNSSVVGTDAVWATRGGKLLKYPFAKNALNNVPTQIETNNLENVDRVISAKGNDVVAFNQDGTLAVYHIDGTSATIHSGSSTSYQNGTNTYEAVVASGSTADKKTIKILKDGTYYTNWSNMPSAPKSLVAFGDYQLYLLTEDGKLYNQKNEHSTGSNYTAPIMTGISSLTATSDGKQLIMQNNEGKVLSYTLDSEGKLPRDSEGKIAAGEELFTPTSVEPQKAFTSKGIRYYISSANNKKLGWSRAAD